MDKISVIIPCYNVEQYIDRCLESVVGQTIGLERLEIITVNDASTDGTLEKLYAWERRFPDSIMVVTYDENLRQGGARNAGLAYATGEYVGFVDSDDWIEPNMYELLYEKMCTGQYDLVKCKFRNELGKEPCPLPAGSRRDVEYHFTQRNGLYYGNVADAGNCGLYGSLCTGLCRRSMFIEHDISFPERLTYEDNYFFGILQLYVGSIYIIDVVLYHYFMNPQSTVRAGNALHHFDRMLIEVMLVEEYRKRGAFEVYHDEIERDFLRRYFLNTWHIIFTRFDDIPDIMGDMKKTIAGIFPNYRECPDVPRTKRQLLLWTVLGMDELPPGTLEAVKKEYLSLGRPTV